jgi:hypothetical protein
MDFTAIKKLIYTIPDISSSQHKFLPKSFFS